MDFFDRAINFTLRDDIEGGLSTDPRDAGNNSWSGATNMGVTQAPYDEYRHIKGLAPQSVKHITKEEAIELYKILYWRRSGCENLPERLSVAHFDWAVNSGAAGAIWTLQEVVGLVPDGGFGPITLKGVRDFLATRGEDALIAAYLKHRERAYRNDPSADVYLEGWLNRLAALREYLALLTPIPSSTAQTKTGMQLVITGTTWLKKFRKQAAELPENLKFLVQPGESFPIAAYKQEQKHWLVTFAEGVTFGGYNTLYIFAEHCRLDGAAKSDGVKLRVPYLSQLDNATDPYGTCNVTSVAMCMAFFGRSTVNQYGQQLEDELNEYCYRHGLDRHVGEHLAILFQEYGYEDRFTRHATWDEVKAWIDSGKPCIVHGYFTQPSGHIVVIIGYNEKGWVVNDSYGEFYSSGYDTSKSGAGLTYSYGLMDRLCSPDNELWIHFPNKVS